MLRKTLTHTEAFIKLSKNYRDYIKIQYDIFNNPKIISRRLQKMITRMDCLIGNGLVLSKGLGNGQVRCIQTSRSKS